MSSRPNDDELRAALDEVMTKGAPAQSERAFALDLRLQPDSGDDAARDEAVLLIEAYQHDPYLWR